VNTENEKNALNSRKQINQFLYRFLILARQKETYNFRMKGTT